MKPTSDATPGLQVRHLTVKFGDTVAVDDVSLSLPTGQITAVLGPSGCGKSTLLRAIAGLERTGPGTIIYQGQDMTAVPPHQRGFALMFQDGQLFSHRTVAQNVAYPLRLRRVGRAERTQKVTHYLELVGLAGYGHRAPASLSGGEQQRVALARALAAQPRLLLLDEPLSALDRDLREHLAGELRQILRQAGTTTLLITHDHEEAFAIADQMAVMRSGQIVQQGTLTDVWRNPVDTWTAQFLGYATVLEGAAAAQIRAIVDPDATWRQVALRRSALMVADVGQLSGKIISIRATPELSRLMVEVAGIGPIAAVAEPSRQLQVGHEVMLTVVADRLAPILP